MKCVIVGPSDRTKLWRFGKIKESDYKNYIESIAGILRAFMDQIIIVPDKGVPLDIAIEYKRQGGREVLGLVPNDVQYGIGHLKPFFIFCDSVKEIKGDWYKLDGELAMQAELVLFVGFSPGSMIELSFIKYHKKYLKINTKVIIDNRTISAPLHPELMDELIGIAYFNTNKELRNLLTQKP